MTQLRLCPPDQIGQHVLVTMVTDVNVQGYEIIHDKLISKKDINPQNKPGQAKYEFLIKGLYLDKNIEPKQHIDLDSFTDAYTSLIEYLLSIKKGTNKIKVAFMSQPVLNATYLSFFAAANESEEMNNNFVMTLFMSSIKEMLFAKKSLEEAKRILTTDFNCLIAGYEKGIFNPIQEAIIKQVAPVQKSLKGKKVIIVDTHNLYHTNYHGMPSLANSKGVYTTIPKSIMSYLVKLQQDSPDYIVFASEDPAGLKNSIRYRTYDKYKSTRDPTPEILSSQIKLTNLLLRKMGFPIIYENGYEGDDIIGSYSRYFEKLGATVEIHTGDKDMFALLSENVTIYDKNKKAYIGPKECEEKFGLPPKDIELMLALAGDTSDCIPGIFRVGNGKAKTLIEKYKTIDGVYNNVDNLTPSLKENVIASKENAYVSVKLSRIHDYLAVDVDLSMFEFYTHDIFYAIKKELEELEINV